MKMLFTDRTLTILAVVVVVLTAGGGAWLAGRPTSTADASMPTSEAVSNSATTASNINTNSSASIMELAVPAEDNAGPIEPAAGPELNTPLHSDVVGNQDPRAILSALLQLPEGAERAQLLLRLAASWSTNAPLEAARALSALPAGPERDAVLGQVIASWSATDPEGALRWIAQEENSEAAGLLRAVAYQSWSSREPAAAGGHALAYGADSGSIQAILAGWTTTDAGAAWDYYQLLPESTRRAVSGSFLLSLAGTDPTRAVDLMSRVISETAHPDQWLALGRSLAQVDLDLALAFEQLLPPGFDQERLKSDLDARLLNEDSDDDAELDATDNETDYVVNRQAITEPAAVTTRPIATVHSAAPGKSATR